MTTTREHAGGVGNIAYEDGHPVAMEEATFIFCSDGKQHDSAVEDKNDERNFSDFDYRMLAGNLCIWIHQDGKASPQSVKLRAYVVALFLTPDVYGYPSVTALAKQAGVSKQSLDRIVQEFRDYFGMILTTMKSEKAREVYRNKPASTKIKHAQTRSFNKLYRDGLELTKGAGI